MRLSFDCALRRGTSRCGPSGPGPIVQRDDQVLGFVAIKFKQIDWVDSKLRYLRAERLNG